MTLNSTATPLSKRLHDKPLHNDEAKLRVLFNRLAGHGLMLMLIDRTASIDAMPIAVIRTSGCQVAYLPGAVWSPSGRPV
ncbi:hypothetical protein [Actinomadura fibrosa]|uniref:Transposase n=1 Tax=Actinomadura fibrosa TaxID=111802 RepID=A0ABW2XGZ8_9ACTN|nr:hypothetical protein [Actinomadura fibrosa]